MAFIDKTTEIAADVHDVYDLWTAFAEYPKFMETVETVTLTQDDRLHWVAVVEDTTFEWDAEIVEGVPDERVTWRAIDGRETGQVRFEKQAGRNTKLTYQLEYEPDAWGGESDTIRDWMSSRVERDLDSFKRLAEEIA